MVSTAQGLYEPLLAHATVAAFVVDRQGHIAYANQRAESLLGYDAGQLAGRLFCDLLAGDNDRHRVPCDARSLPRDGDHLDRDPTSIPDESSIAAELWRRDGSALSVEVTSSPVIDGGSATGWLHLVRGSSIRRRLPAVEDRHNELEALSSLSAALTASHEPDRLLSTTLQRVVELTNAVAAAISLLDVESQTMSIAAHTGLPPLFLGDRIGQSLGEGDVGRVATTGQPLARDATLIRVHRDRTESWAWMAVPVKAHERTLGVLEVFRPEPPFDAPAVHLLTAVGAQLGIAYQHAWLSREMEANLEAQGQLRLQLERLYRREQRRADQFRVANELGRRIASILERDRLLWEVVELLCRSFDYYYVVVALIDEHGPSIQAAFGRDRGRDVDLIGVRLDDPEHSLAAWVANHGELLLVPDVTRETRYHHSANLDQARSALAVPLRGREGVLGVLDIESDRLADFDGIDVVLLEALAAQVSVALENARLYAQTREVGKLEERNRLAREIHDTLAQGFTGIVLQLEAAEQSAPVDLAEAMDHVTRARELARESLAEARRSVWDLRPSPLERRGLNSAVQFEVDRFVTATNGQVVTTFTHPPFLGVLPQTVETAALRIVQEALQNARLHARATEVEIELTMADDHVGIRITDDGVGIDRDRKSVSRGSGFGLISMQERAQLIGGGFVVRSELGRGTSIEVTLPLRPIATGA